jgi:hypothetical protein
MTQLANADLLDESVANSGSLKKQRLNNTAQTASNPNSNPSPTPTLKKVDINDDEASNDDDYQNLQDEYNNTGYKMQDTERKSDDDKILGMSKPLAIGLGIIIIGVGAYFGYKYFKNKTKKISANAPSGADVAIKP